MDAQYIQKSSIHGLQIRVFFWDTSVIVFVRSEVIFLKPCRCILSDRGFKDDFACSSKSLKVI